MKILIFNVRPESGWRKKKQLQNVKRHLNRVRKEGNAATQHTFSFFLGKGFLVLAPSQNVPRANTGKH